VGGLRSEGSEAAETKQATHQPPPQVAFRYANQLMTKY